MAKHKAPKNMKEYTALFFANERVEGFGAETAVVMPCPFCAAPDWLRAKITEVNEVMAQDHGCLECERVAKFVFDHKDGGTTFWIVQTGGPDQPDWLEPKYARLEDQPDEHDEHQE